MKDNNRLDLRLFGGEGAGAPGGESAAEGAVTGSNTADAGRQRLRELGVPEERLDTKGQYTAQRGRGRRVASGTENSTPKGEAGGKNASDSAERRMSWEEILADPEYQKQLQSTVNRRLKSAKAAGEAMEKLAPALELLYGKYGLYPKDTDYEALCKAIRAESMGQGQPGAKAVQAAKPRDYRGHFESLKRQGEAMRKTFPGFDLQAEMRNPVFARMTSPGVGISVEDAYYALHRRDIQSVAMQATAQRTAQSISNSIRSGRKRPGEAGVSGQSPSVSSFDYSKASREQREALKRRIRESAARGEKVYPGR